MSQVKYKDISEIMHVNKSAGNKFFSHGAMQFFKSRICPTIYGGRYFVTSELVWDIGRRYSIRECSDDGAIITHHSMIGSHKEAVKHAKELAHEDQVVKHIAYYSRYR